jgi:ABC-type oligopeptide transport system substrate-binding subunit/predicted Ser/Thr protein kinase
MDSLSNDRGDRNDSSPNQVPSIGSCLDGRYRLDAELGRGGLGVVYRAHDMLLARDVAIKVLVAAALSDEGRARLLREAQAAARLHHPNIITVYDAREPESGALRGGAYIVMELVEGQTLQDCASRSISDMLRGAQQVCAALEHAHAHGIIHRDLKPENIVVTPDGSAKLMDFGLASTPDALRLTTDGALVGTIDYLAPELIQGHPASPQSDLYALGVILYECTTGRLPFGGENMMQVLSQHLYATVVPPSTHNPAIPPAFESLILRLLSKRPEERPASATAVLQQLANIAALPTAALAGSEGEPSLLDRLVRGRLVGRDREMEQAQALWQQAISGAEGDRVLLISGEPGVGKTRLARELATLARVSHAAVIGGECYAEGGAPYAPLGQAIQSAFGSPRLLSKPPQHTILADLLTLAPSLRARFPDVPPNPPLGAQAEQQRLYESLTQFCLEISPLLLVVEDVHWADGSTCAILRHLARRVRALQAPLLIVLTYREVELDSSRALNDMLHDLTRERLATRIKLARLSREATGEMLAAIFAEEVPPEFLDGIYRETEGNPFYVEEVCKALVEGTAPSGDHGEMDSRKLHREHGHWRWPRVEEVEIPQSMAIQARVDTMPPAARDTLRLAAIYGRDFSFAALRAVSDLDEEALIEALETAERAQLIEEVRSGPGAKNQVSFTFAHALIPSALHEGLSGLRRQRLHRRAAEALERLYPAQVAQRELAPQLARHYAQAGEWDRATDYWLEAGERAREVYAYPEAIGYLQQALALLKEQAAADLDRAARISMKLGMLYHTTFDYQRSRQIFQDAFALWQRAGEVHPETALPPAPHALRQYWPCSLETLDPTLANDASAIPLIEQLFCGLVELTPEFDVVPALARAWEVSADGCEYVFRLRADARWSDGHRLTAGDVEYAWKRALNPATHSALAELLLDVVGARAYHSGQVSDAGTVGVRALDDYTLVVEVDEPVGHFLHLLGVVVTYPLPRHAIEAHGPDWCKPEHIVTNGPFRLEAWQEDQRFLLVRNPHYCGRFGGNLSRVELDLFDYETPGDKMASYEAGQHDVAHPQGLAMLELARRQHAREYRTLPSAHTLYVSLDANRPPFNDLRVRQAMSHALDREALADAVWHGAASPATGGFVPPGMPGHSPGLELAYDPDRARRLLAEAGYPRGEGFPAVDAVAHWSAPDEPTGLYLQAQWRQVLGLEFDWKRLDWLAYKERLIAHPPQIHVMGWVADYPDPDCFLRVAMHQPYVTWRNDSYEQLLEAARRITDETERLKFYRAADRVLIEEAAIIPLFHGQQHYLIKPWVRRFPCSPIRVSYWKDAILDPH